MAREFLLPSRLRDLEESDDSIPQIKAVDVTDLAGLLPEDISSFVNGVVFDLGEKEVLCIEEQGVFDQVYSVLREFSLLDSKSKQSLVDALCTNLSVLRPSISSLGSSTFDAENAADVNSIVQSHRNAFRIYAYFLHTIILLEEESSGTEVPGGDDVKRKQSRKKHVTPRWDWETVRVKVLRILAASLDVDLKQLYHMRDPEEALIGLFAKTGFTLLESATVIKDKEVKQEVCSMIANCVAKYHYVVPTTASMVHLLHKHEHVPVHLADVVAVTSIHYTNSSLAISILRELARTSPREYLRDFSGASNVGTFLVELAERLPKLMAANISVLMLHLDGESYPMRSALVTVMGKILAKVYKKEPDGEISSGSKAARLRSKQVLLDKLMERTRDTSAYTRSRVLQTWTYLFEEEALPVAYYATIAKLAVGRLEDKSTNVRKSALQLLNMLLQVNPFGPLLRASAFEVELEKYKVRLQELSSSSSSSEDEENKDEAGEGGADGDGNLGLGADGDLSPAETEAPATQFPESSSQDLHPPASNGAGEARSWPNMDGGIQHTRVMVANLDAGLNFARAFSSSMPQLEGLLASAAATDVKETIHLLQTCKHFQIDGAEACVRKILPLVFSQDNAVKESVLEACLSLFLRKDAPEAANNLINLVVGASLGDLASLQAIISDFSSKGDINAQMVSTLWELFKSRNVPAARKRGALIVLSMAAMSRPEILSSQVQNLMDVGFGPQAREDPLLARWTCVALQRLSPRDVKSMGPDHKVFSFLRGIIMSKALPDESWYSAAQQAVNAIYATHPVPEKFCASILRALAASTFSSKTACYGGEENDVPGTGAGGAEADVESEVVSDGEAGAAERVRAPQPPTRRVPGSMGCHSEVSATALCRFLFIVGQVALKQLVYVEDNARAVRRLRQEKEKAAAQAAADRQDKALSEGSEATQMEQEGINEELGVGAVSADALLDDLHERTEKEIVSGRKDGRRFLISAIAPMVARLCHNAVLIQEHPQLQASAMLSLCKLMAIDATFCEANLQVVFTVLQNSPFDFVRSNCIIALGDLAFRFPNLLEPWTEHMYGRLRDTSPAVRKNAVLVLTHLIINDMMKVKGYISEMALRLEDEDKRISDLIRLFFHELSKKGNNPIYNLLPDMLSRLSTTEGLELEIFRSVMEFLIGFIQKDKQMEGLVEKLCHRFTGTSDLKQSRDIAYCLALLNYTEKAFKKLVDMFKNYQDWLFDEEVVEHFKTITTKVKSSISKGKKGEDGRKEFRAAVEEFEENVMKVHKEKHEDEMAARKAAEHKLKREQRKFATDPLAPEGDAENVGEAASKDHQDSLPKAEPVDEGEREEEREGEAASVVESKRSSRKKGTRQTRQNLVVPKPEPIEEAEGEVGEESIAVRCTRSGKKGSRRLQQKGGRGTAGGQGHHEEANPAVVVPDSQEEEDASKAGVVDDVNSLKDNIPAPSGGRSSGRQTRSAGGKRCSGETGSTGSFVTAEEGIGQCLDGTLHADSGSCREGAKGGDAGDSGGNGGGESERDEGGGDACPSESFGSALSKGSGGIGALSDGGEEYESAAEYGGEHDEEG